MSQISRPLSLRELRSMHCNKGTARTPELCCLSFSWRDAAGQARLAEEGDRQKALPTEPNWLRCQECWPVWLPVSHFPLPSGVCPQRALVSPSLAGSDRKLLNLESRIPADSNPIAPVERQHAQKTCALLLLALLKHQPAGGRRWGIFTASSSRSACPSALPKSGKPEQPVILLFPNGEGNIYIHA